MGADEMGAAKRDYMTMPEAPRIDMPLVRASVRKLLENAERLDGWSYQGFGMFRLYLSKAIRLHVWDPSQAVEGVTTIHTHPWHFRSTVVSGRMVDKLYALPLLDTGASTHQMQQIVCGPGGGACGEPQLVRLERLQEAVISVGQSYGLTAKAPHESMPDPGTVTLIERRFLPDEEHAYVFPPIGQPWVSAEPRPATRKEVAEMMELALGRWSDG